MQALKVGCGVGYLYSVKKCRMGCAVCPGKVFALQNSDGEGAERRLDTKDLTQRMQRQEEISDMNDSTAVKSKGSSGNWRETGKEEGERANGSASTRAACV